MKQFKCLMICFIVIFDFVEYGRGHLGGHNVCGDKIPCDNLRCIERHFWCDWEIDCEDGSDENYCFDQWAQDPKINKNCTDKHFICDNSRCVPVVVMCDGFNDCGDASDEFICFPSDFHKRTHGSTTPETVANTRTIEPVPVGVRNDKEASSFSTYDAAVRAISPTPKSSAPTSPTVAHTPAVVADYHLGIAAESVDLPQPLYDYSNHQDESRNDQRNLQSQRNPSSLHENTGFDIPPEHLLPTNEDLAPPPVPNVPEAAAGVPPPATYGGGYDSSRTLPNSDARRQQHPVIESRAVLYPPNSRQLSYNQRKARRLVLPTFFFASNYTEQFGYNYQRNVEKAKEWILEQRDSSYSWGQDTPRALAALSLISNSFTSDVADNELMKKGLQIHLGIKLLRKKTQPVTVTRLAMYINALLATCQNPRNFLGQDLVDELYQRRNLLNQFQPAVYPFVYLTLCISNVPFSGQDIQQLESLLAQRFSDEAERDRHILATTALACVLQQDGGGDYELGRQLHQIRGTVNDAIYTLLNHRNDEGNFGSVYSTAIAAQAIMSANFTSWDPRRTLDYLARQQHEDGSFGDMLSTYYSLGALSGRGLVHLRNTQCDETAAVDQGPSPNDILNRPGPKKSVFVSLKVGYPETFSFSIQIIVPVDTNLLDTMRVAAYLDPRFRFRHKVHNDELDIYEISKIPNDPERGLYWNLFVLDHSDTTVDLSRRYEGNIKTLIPKDSQELLYWYLSTV